MAKKTTKSKRKTKTTPKFKKPSLKLSSQQKLIFGSLLIILGVLMFIAFLSFFFTGKADQNTLTELGTREVEAQNWLNKLGAWISDLFIHKGFGISSFIFSGLVFLSGIYITLDINKARLRRHWIWGTLIAIWLSVFFGFFSHKFDMLGGIIGFEMNSFLQDYIGKIGTALLLLFVFITYLAIRYKVTGESFVRLFNSAKKDIQKEIKTDEVESTVPFDNNLTTEAEEIKSAFELNLENSEPVIESPDPLAEAELDPELEPQLKTDIKETRTSDSDLDIEIENVEEELSETDNLSDKLVEDFGLFDPTLELSKFQFPPLDLLKKYDTEGITINQEELEENEGENEERKQEPNC